MGLFNFFSSSKKKDDYSEMRRRRECKHEHLGAEVAEFCGPNRRYEIYQECLDCGARIYVGWETIAEHEQQ